MSVGAPSSECVENSIEITFHTKISKKKCKQESLLRFTSLFGLGRQNSSSIPFLPQGPWLRELPAKDKGTPKFQIHSTTARPLKTITKDNHVLTSF